MSAATSSGSLLGRWRSADDLARLDVVLLDGISLVQRWEGRADAGPGPGQAHRPPELFAGLVVVKVLFALFPVVVVVVQTLHRFLTLHRARVFFDGDFAPVRVW